MEEDFACSILGFLKIKEMTGYEIKKITSNTIFHFWNFSYSQIYPLLKKLEENGFVKKKTLFSGKKPRHIYSITKEGINKLEKWRRSSHSSEEKKIPFLLKIFFAEDDISIKDFHLKNFLNENYQKKENLLELKKNLDQFKDYGLGVENIDSLSDSLDFGIHITSSKIQWAQKKLNDKSFLEKD